MEEINIKKTVKYIVEWIEDYANMANINTLVVGVSGGIDSAVVSTLCAMTGKNVILVEMPIGVEYSMNGLGGRHIVHLQKKFDNVTHRVLDLTDTYMAFKKTIDDTTNHIDYDNYELMLANTASRCRMMALYSFSNIHKGLVVGTGNKVEDFGIGFFTVGGDGQVDISPIADLMKSEVYSIANYLDLLPDIQKSIPTDGLWQDSRTDEGQIGASYDELEWAMNYSSESKENLTDRQKEVLDIYLTRHIKNKFKMLPIPICKIPND